MSVQNLTPVVDSTQAAAQTTTPNPTDNTIMSDTPAPDVPAINQEVTDPAPSDQEVPGGSVTPAVSSINPEVVALLVAMLAKATGSAFYMSNDKRVAVLKEALNIPVSDDKSFQQFFNHAEKDLVTASYQNARKNGGTPVEVTTAMVMAAAHEKYVAKHGKRAIVNEEYTV